MTEKNKSSVSVSVFGCLPFLLGCLLLGALGMCGQTCQDDILSGVKSIRSAVTGQ